MQKHKGCMLYQALLYKTIFYRTALYKATFYKVAFNKVKAQVFVALCSLLACVQAFAAPAWLSEAGIYARGKSLTYSENMPIDAFDNEFQGAAPRSGNHAFTFNQYEIGFLYKNWLLAKTQRFDYFFNFNDQTFDIFYMDGNDIEFPINVAYDTFLRVQKVETEGIKVGYRWPVNDVLSLQTHLNYFTADDALYGVIEGRLWQSPTRIRGDLELDYIYAEDVVFDRPQIDPNTGQDIAAGISGYGYSLDFAAYWDLEQWDIALEMFDAIGRTGWRNVPFTTAIMVSNRDQIDENGMPIRVPTLRAREGFRETVQTLPKRRRAEAVWYPWRKFLVAAEYERLDQVHFNRWYAGYKPASWFDVRLGFDRQSQEKSFTLRTPYFSIVAGTNRTDLKQSRNIRLEIAMQYVFK